MRDEVGGPSPVLAVLRSEVDIGDPNPLPNPEVIDEELFRRVEVLDHPGGLTDSSGSDGHGRRSSPQRLMIGLITSSEGVGHQAEVKRYRLNVQGV